MSVNNIPATIKTKDGNQILKSLKSKAARRRIESKFQRKQHERRLARQKRIEYHNNAKEKKIDIPFDCVVCGFETDTLLKFLCHVKEEHYKKNEDEELTQTDNNKQSIISTDLNIKKQEAFEPAVTETKNNTSSKSVEPTKNQELKETQTSETVDHSGELNVSELTNVNIIIETEQCSTEDKEVLPTNNTTPGCSDSDMFVEENSDSSNKTLPDLGQVKKENLEINVDQKAKESNDINNENSYELLSYLNLDKINIAEDNVVEISDKNTGNNSACTSPKIVPGSVESISLAIDSSGNSECFDQVDLTETQANNIESINLIAIKQEKLSISDDQIDDNFGLQILSTVSLSTGEHNNTHDPYKLSVDEPVKKKREMQVSESQIKKKPPAKITLTKTSTKKLKCSTASRLESIVQSLKTEHVQNPSNSFPQKETDFSYAGDNQIALEMPINTQTNVYVIPERPTPTTSGTPSNATEVNADNTLDIATINFDVSPMNSGIKWRRCSSPIFSMPYLNLASEGMVTMLNNNVTDENCHPVHIFMLLGSYFQFPYPQPEEVLYLSRRTRLHASFLKQWFVKKRLKHGISWSPDEVLNAWAFITERHGPSNSGSSLFYMDRLDHCQSLNRCDIKMTSNIVLKKADVSYHDKKALTTGYMTINCTCSNIHLIGAVQHEVLTSVQDTIKPIDLSPGSSKLEFIVNMTCLKECAVITFFNEFIN